MNTNVPNNQPNTNNHEEYTFDFLSDIESNDIKEEKKEILTQPINTNYQDIKQNNEINTDELYKDGIIKINMGEDDKNDANSYIPAVSPAMPKETNTGANNEDTQKNSVAFIVVLVILLGIFIMLLPTITKIIK